MTYSKTEWKDRVVEKPNTFSVTQHSDGTITLIPAPGQVVERGTPINATNLNKIENALKHISDNFLDKSIGGDIKGNLNVLGQLFVTGWSKMLIFSTGEDDIYICNTKSGKYLRLKDDGSLVYDGQTVSVDTLRANNIYPSSPCVGWVGDDVSPFWGMRVAGGGFNQSSDINVKEDIHRVDDEIYFNLVKELPVHKYLYRDSEALGDRASDAMGDELLNIGILAQEALSLDGSEFFINGNEVEGYSVNLYCYSAAIMSALKAEISKRELLEKRVSVLETLLNKDGIK